jgi:hypothetical protein
MARFHKYIDKERFMARFFKSLLFYPLFFLRGIVRLVLGFLGGVCGLVCPLLAAIAYFGHTPRLWFPAGILLLLSFLLFVLRVSYAWILLKLNPTDNTLILDL